MSHDPSRWRSSPSYEYVDHLTAPDVGWEWLRRNEEYQRDYAELAGASSESPSLIERAGEAWGLRFPCRSFSEVDRNANILAPGRRHRVGDPDAGASVFRRR